MQGDVVGIYDLLGNEVVKYAYDAYGNCTVTTGAATNIGGYNHITYRGYYYEQNLGMYWLQTRFYDANTGRFISPDSTEYLDTDAVHGVNLYAYCGNCPTMFADPSGHVSQIALNILAGIGIILGTALFVVSIIASAGAVGAMAGVASAAIGLSASAVAQISTFAVIGTYAVAAGVALFGLSDAIERFSGGINPIRDYVLDGDQKTYDIISGTLYILGTIATIIGAVGPKALQGIAKTGVGSREGFVRNFYGNSGWNLRIDATTHGNPKYHHNPHIHYLYQGNSGEPVHYFWEIIKGWFVK